MMKIRFPGILLLATALVSTPAYPQAPPPAPIRPVTDDYFGTKVVDNYRYFEDLKNPDVQQWMKAQADYTRATLDSLQGHAALLKRIAELEESRLAQVGGLQIVGGRYYTLRTPSGASSAKLYVRDGVNGEDHLLIDPEKLSTGQQTHMSIQGYRPSPDGRYVAYQLAAGGSEESVLHILDVQSGKDLAETADRAYGLAPFWRADSKSFFYRRGQKLESGMPKTAKYQNGRVYLHRLGRAFDDDPPILGRDVSDPAIALTPIDWIEIVTAPGSHYAIAFVSPGTDPRLRVYAAPIDAVQDGKTVWRPIAASYDDQYIGGLYSGGDSDYPVALTRDTLYWLSRKDAPRGRILKLDLAHPRSKPEIVVPQGELPISEVYAARDAIYWRVSDAGVNSVSRLRFARGAKPEALRLPYAADVVDVATDRETDATALLALSWLHSNAYLGVAAKTGAVTDTGLQPAGPYDHLDDLVVDEVKVKSWDGVEVPLSIVHKKGLKLDGNNLTEITGYGAYGMSSSPRSDPAWRAWYERGGVQAVAHVRGGGEYGEAWHQAGFQATKPNTWKDFIACAQYLVDHKYTNPHKLIGSAGSAGGILIGRAIEERPDLFAGDLMIFPVADTLRFETTANGPRNAAEFGSIKTEAGFRALYAMSSYANVKDGVKYPAALVYASINDPRVAAWIPAKFVARLQAATTSGKPVLLRLNFDAGHGMGTMRQSELSRADAWSFALWETGDPEFQPKQ
jgi:prolyl oligopeptidase